MDVERVWLAHPDLPNSAWACPVDAVDYWKTRGFVESEPAEPVNPVLVEYVAPNHKPTKTKSTAKADASEKGSD